VEQAVPSAIPKTFPDAATVRSLADFLVARYNEAEIALAHVGHGPGYEHRAVLTLAAHGLYTELGARGAAEIESDLTRYGRWTSRTERVWWTMLAVARLHILHPELPYSVRPFLNAKEWQ
jgi:hypothetical protein